MLDLTTQQQKPLDLTAPKRSLLASQALDIAGSTSFGRGWESGSLSERVGSLMDEANNMYRSSQEAALSGDSGLAQALHQQAQSLEMQGRDKAIQAQQWAPTTQSFTDINSAGSAVDWMAGSLGQGLRSTMPSIAGGLVGAGLGAAAAPFTLGVINPATGARIGSALGAAIPGYNMEANETIAAGMMDPGVRANKSMQEIKDTGRVKGAVAGALEAVVPAMVVGKATGLAGRVAKGDRLAAIGKSAGQGALTEFATEGAQDISGQIAENSLKDQALSDIDPKQAFNAAMAGAVAGGGMGAMGGAAQVATGALGDGKDVVKDPLATAAHTLGRKAGDAQQSELIQQSHEALRILDDPKSSLEERRAAAQRYNIYMQQNPLATQEEKDNAAKYANTPDAYADNLYTTRREKEQNDAHDAIINELNGGKKKSLMRGTLTDDFGEQEGRDSLDDIVTDDQGNVVLGEHGHSMKREVKDGYGGATMITAQPGATQPVPGNEVSAPNTTLAKKTRAEKVASAKQAVSGYTAIDKAAAAEIGTFHQPKQRGVKSQNTERLADAAEIWRKQGIADKLISATSSVTDAKQREMSMAMLKYVSEGLKGDDGNVFVPESLVEVYGSKAGTMINSAAQVAVVKGLADPSILNDAKHAQKIADDMHKQNKDEFGAVRDNMLDAAKKIYSDKDVAKFVPEMRRMAQEGTTKSEEAFLMRLYGDEKKIAAAMSKFKEKTKKPKQAEATARADDGYDGEENQDLDYEDRMASANKGSHDSGYAFRGRGKDPKHENYNAPFDLQNDYHVKELSEALGGTEDFTVKNGVFGIHDVLREGLEGDLLHEAENELLDKHGYDFLSDSQKVAMEEYGDGLPVSELVNEMPPQARRSFLNKINKRFVMYSPAKTDSAAAADKVESVSALEASFDPRTESGTVTKGALYLEKVGAKTPFKTTVMDILRHTNKANKIENPHGVSKGVGAHESMQALMQGLSALFETGKFTGRLGYKTEITEADKKEPFASVKWVENFDKLPGDLKLGARTLADARKAESEALASGDGKASHKYQPEFAGTTAGIRTALEKVAKKIEEEINAVVTEVTKESGFKAAKNARKKTNGRIAHDLQSLMPVDMPLFFTQINEKTGREVGRDVLTELGSVIASPDQKQLNKVYTALRNSWLSTGAALQGGGSTIGTTPISQRRKQARPLIEAAKFAAAHEPGQMPKDTTVDPNNVTGDHKRNRKYGRTDADGFINEAEDITASEGDATRDVQEHAGSIRDADPKSDSGKDGGSYNPKFPKSEDINRLENKRMGAALAAAAKRKAADEGVATPKWAKDTPVFSEKDADALKVLRLQYDNWVMRGMPGAKSTGGEIHRTSRGAIAGDDTNPGMVEGGAASNDLVAPTTQDDGKREIFSEKTDKDGRVTRTFKERRLSRSTATMSSRNVLKKPKIENRNVNDSQSQAMHPKDDKRQKAANVKLGAAQLADEAAVTHLRQGVPHAVKVAADMHNATDEKSQKSFVAYTQALNRIAHSTAKQVSKDFAHLLTNSGKEMTEGFARSIIQRAKNTLDGLSGKEIEGVVGLTKGDGRSVEKRDTEGSAGAKVADSQRNVPTTKLGDAKPSQEEKVTLPGNSKYTAKDQAKSDKANKFIGRGSAQSSTAAYAAAWGDRANTGEYSSSDTVFVSAEGNRAGRVDPDLGEIKKAIEVGATLITDDQQNRARPYNKGERQVAEFLEKNGYKESTPGVWGPAKNGVQAEQGNRLIEGFDAEFGSTNREKVSALINELKSLLDDTEIGPFGRHRFTYNKTNQSPAELAQFLEYLSGIERNLSMTPKQEKVVSEMLTKAYRAFEQWAGKHVTESVDPTAPMFSKQSAEATKGATQEEIDAAREQIMKSCGPDTVVDFQKSFADNSSGSFTPGETQDVISVALNSDVAGTGFHEAMHKFFKLLRKHGGETTQNMLERVAKNPIVMRQLEVLLHEHPEAWGQAKSNPEEAAAFMYQFWAKGLLKLGPQSTNFFGTIKNFLMRTFGRISKEMKDEIMAEKVMRAFKQGEFADTTVREAAIAALSKKMEDHNTALQATGKGWSTFVRTVGRAVMSAEGVLTAANNPYLIKISKLFNQSAGAAMSKIGDFRGSFFDAYPAAHAYYQNKFDNIIDGLKREELDIVRKMLATGRDSHIEHIQKAVEGIREFNKQMAKYITSRNIMRVNDKGQWEPVKPRDDFGMPQIWDKEKVLENRDEVIKLLIERHSKELQAIAREANGELSSEKGMGLAAKRAKDDNTVVSPEMVAEAIVDRIIESGKVDSSENASNLGISPFSASVNRRSLDWIDNSIFDQYKEQDLINAYTTYIANMTKRGEYTVRFGHDGKVLRDLMEQAHAFMLGGDELLNKAQSELPEALELWRTAGRDSGHSEPTLVGVARGIHKRENPDTYEADLDKAMKSMGVYEKAVMGMEGTLGRDISNASRNINSALVTYQSVRLLSASLFTSFNDIVGITLNGGTLQDAWDAFVTGIREVKLSAVNDTKSRDSRAKQAELWGTVEALSYNDVLGQAYQSMYMSGKFKTFSDKFFRRIGMEGWNRGMRIAATAVGERIIQNWAKNGVDVKDKAEVARFERLFGEGANPEDIVLNSDGTLDMNDIHNRAAMARFVNDAVLRPNAAHRTIWGSDPNFAALWQLKSYTYSFHKVILEAVLKQAALGNYRPAMVAMVGYAPVAIAAGALKEMLIPGDEPPWMKSGLDGYLSYGFDRANLLGVPQMYAGALNPLGKGFDPANLFGPTVDEIQGFASIPFLQDKSLLGETAGALPLGNFARRAVGG